MGDSELKTRKIYIQWEVFIQLGRPLPIKSSRSHPLTPARQVTVNVNVSVWLSVCTFSLKSAETEIKGNPFFFFWLILTGPSSFLEAHPQSNFWRRW